MEFGQIVLLLLLILVTNIFVYALGITRGIIIGLNKMLDIVKKEFDIE